MLITVKQRKFSSWCHISDHRFEIICGIDLLGGKMDENISRVHSKVNVYLEQR